MKSRHKKGIIAAVLLAFAAALLCAFIFGAGGFSYGKTDGGQIAASASSSKVFTFDSVRLEAQVNSDKTLDVTETLVANWNASGKRSLIRDIQRQSRTTRVVDGKRIKGKNYFAGISDISATLDGKECYWHIISSSDEMYLSGFYSIEMMQADGSDFAPDRPYTFVLKYKYDMGDDRLRRFDDFTYDIFGYEMNTAQAFSAKITLPEGVTLNESDVSLRFSEGNGYEPFTPEKGLERYFIENNVIEIETARLTTGLTLQVILPKGTFTGGITMYWYYWIFLAVAAVAVVAALALFFKNMPVKPVEPVEFYPPEDVSVMKFSAIWHKAANSKDAAALILKWADMGLLTVEKEGANDLTLRLGEAYLTLTETEAEENPPEFDAEVFKDARGRRVFDSAEEMLYFKTLFSGIGGESGVFSTKTFKKGGVANQARMYNATLKLTNSVKSYKVIKPVKKARALIAFAGLVPTAAVLIYNLLVCQNFIPLFMLVFMAAGTFAGLSGIKEDGKLVTPLVLIFPVMFYAMPYAVILWQFAMPLYDYASLIYIAPVIYAVCMFILPFLIGKRTEEANVLYGRIRGFRHFLLTAELPRIQLLFDENPEYFSDILPWCMIMNISDKVQKRFAALESIDMPKVLEDNIDVRFVTRCIVYSSVLGAPRSSSGGGGGSFGGGGRGGSFGGGGGGGGSRSR